MKSFLTSVSLLAMFLLMTPLASAHVVVTPATAGIGSYQTFTISVPNEKKLPTVGIRLAIPDGVTSVTPTVKQGWTISVDTSGTGAEASTTQITWTGSHIPVGQRDEFTFSAKVPAQEGSIVWKAYQTYSDGSVVSWDTAPVAHDHEEGMEMDEEESSNPASVTEIVDDLATKHGDSDNDLAPWTFGLSLLALLVAAYAVYENGVQKPKNS